MYHIQNQSGDYPIIVFSVCYISPIENYRKIEEELVGHQGTILFDLLLSNGLSSNRYITAEYSEGKFDLMSFKELVNPPYELKLISTYFYQKHSNFLENSVLPSAHQFLIKKGKVL